MTSDPVRCYIHIGAPKTGSTFLQTVFCENRDALRRLGLLYPDVSLRGFGHHDLAFLLSGGYPDWAVEQDRPLHALAADLAAIANCHNGSLLLSSENFYLFPKPADLKHLLEATGALSRRAARIVVYIRRQDDAHESWHNQRVKAQGETGSIEESCERFHDLWDYERQLGLWSDVFGQDAMVVKRYVPPDRASPSLVDEMFDVLGISGFVPRLPAHHVNSRENRDILSFQRQLNRLPLSPQEKRRFHKQLMELSEKSRGLGIFDERPLLGPCERQAIMKRYAAGNAAVAARYFNGEALFPDVPSNAGAGTLDGAPADSGLTSEKMAAILGWLLAHRD